MKAQFVVVTLLCAAAAVSAVNAQQPKSLEQLQREEQFHEMLSTLKKADDALEAFAKKRTDACSRAIGYPPFCDCVLKDLPIGWSFDDYVAITTRSKDVNGYSQMSPEYKAAYDKVGPLRDRCVTKINERK